MASENSEPNPYGSAAQADVGAAAGKRVDHGVLTVTEKVGYGLGDTASNLFWKTFEFFLMYFYTDVFGLKAKSAGTMMLVTRIWDAINDPIVGYLADRHQNELGQISTLPGLDGNPLRDHRDPDLLYAGLGAYRKADLRVRHLHTGDDGLYGDQHSLRRIDGCDLVKLD